jgi:threonine dehydratase
MPKPTKIVAPTLKEFERAHEIVGQVANVTPVLRSNYLSQLTNSDVWLKAENLQRTGAYKVRGAYHRMIKLTDAERASGVVAASAGNHAQGVALAAKRLGIEATIFMPVGASLPKFQATQNYGAKVVLEGAAFAETLKAAQEYAAKKGAVFIAPFDHMDVVLGQGTVGLEILDQLQEVDSILVAIGGGGLAAGVAVAAKLKAAEIGHKIKIIGVQSANAASYRPSLKAGEPTQIQTSPTIADGIAVSKPGAIPFALIAANIDKVVTVNDDQIARAIVTLLERSKMVVEPAGAVGVAALMAGKFKPKGRTVVVLSGGNIDPLLMQKVIGHGLVASDRYVTISVMLPDRPGMLVKTAEAVARAHGNVVEVMHTRHGNDFEISEVELKMSIETTGAEHSARVLKELQAAGLKAKVSDN